MKIVIVEDEIRICEGIKKLLGKLNKGYEIVGEAQNGEAGLSLLRELKPDIVITDIKMPQMDGLEMLTQMTKEGLPVKAIVLSAYSEFEYARQTMKLGVTEYLLKPISINEFSQALENVELQIEKSRQEKPKKIGTLEQILRDFLGGRMTMDKEIAAYLNHKYQIEEMQPFIVVCIYMGKNYEMHQEETKRYLQHAFSTYPGISFSLIDSQYKKSWIAVIYHYLDSHDLERWLQYQILNHVTKEMALGWTEIIGIHGLKSGIDALSPYMDWNISFNEDVLISFPKITKVQTVPCIYPIEMESKVKVEICAFEWDKVTRIIKKFHEYFENGKIYKPKEIKECYVRFLWAVMGIAKEIGCLDYTDVDQQKILEMIMGAKRKEELKEEANYILEKVHSKKTEDNTTDLTVRRVKSMIHEFYQSGITLEEIGSKLHLTPEYLGTQFHKEMGVTFNTYMKNHRINKAKELLCGTQLKVYEIADRVGYSDPKYFSKVFKEVMGQLPAEYRSVYK